MVVYNTRLSQLLTFIGSNQLRAGWATESSPRLSIENLVARYKERKAPKTYCLVGNDVLADQAARAASKSPYEGPVVSNWDLMVQEASE
jgi:actin-related protein 5